MKRAILKYLLTAAFLFLIFPLISFSDGYERFEGGKKYNIEYDKIIFEGFIDEYDNENYEMFQEEAVVIENRGKLLLFIRVPNNLGTKRKGHQETYMGDNKWFRKDEDENDITWESLTIDRTELGDDFISFRDPEEMSGYTLRKGRLFKEQSLWGSGAWLVPKEFTPGREHFFPSLEPRPIPKMDISRFKNFVDSKYKKEDIIYVGRAGISQDAIIVKDKDKKVLFISNYGDPSIGYPKEFEIESKDDRFDLGKLEGQTANYHFYAYFKGEDGKQKLSLDSFEPLLLHGNFVEGEIKGEEESK